MTAKQVRACVAAYFRYKRQCPVVAFERGLCDYMYRPEVSVVTKTRKLIEVEVKVSYADFIADSKKRIWMFRDRGFRAMPTQFYYAVPKDLVESVRKELRVDVGLLSVDEINRIPQNRVCVEVKAPVMRKSRLGIREVIQMVRHQTGTLVSLALKES